MEAQQLAESISSQYRGPGGACAILKDGQVIAQHVWGFANLEQRIPMTAGTIFPICSISKQFICLVLAELLRQPGAPAKADRVMREMLPASLAGNNDLTLERLAYMQSGIRDYWALTVLWGAQPDGRFTLEKDAPAALERLGNFHFEPGAQFSYSNVNFYVLGRIAEELAGKPLEKVLAEHVFQPAGMPTAKLHPDTNDRPGPIVGYEGTEVSGFFRALNRIEWAGDAGIVASLDDMIMYEKYIDRQQADADSIYRQNARPTTFANGSPAWYGWGLARSETADLSGYGHGGGLRGFSLHRRYTADARVSVLVMLNHEVDAQMAVNNVLDKLLLKPGVASEQVAAAPEWKGAYFDPDADLAVTVTNGESIGELKFNFSFLPEKANCTTAHEAHSASMTASLSGDVLTVHRPKENRNIKARRIPPITEADHSHLTGKYRSDEVDSTFHVTGSSDMLYGAFDGYLGHGPAYLMKQLGDGIWYLSTQRTLDSSPPGNWTIVFNQSTDGKIEGVTLGCLLARKVPYVRVRE